MKPIRVLLVDDQPLFRDGLRMLLSVRPEVQVVGEVSNGDNALQAVHTLSPDIVLMDLHMPVMNGIECTRRLRAASASCRIIVLTTFDDDEDVFEALRAGANGYLLKGVSAAKLVEGIQLTMEGQSILQPSVDFSFRWSAASRKFTTFRFLKIAARPCLRAWPAHPFRPPARWGPPVR